VVAEGAYCEQAAARDQVIKIHRMAARIILAGC
jgi:hypothetical protein